MGGTLDSIGWLLVAVLLLLALAAAVIAIRRYLLERGGGTVECALRAPAGGAWRPGVASYHPDELYWYRAVGILLRPDRVFTRRSLRVLSRRPATSPEEEGALGPGRAVVELDAGPAGRIELAMASEALTGFLAWLEASPPSSHLRDIA